MKLKHLSIKTKLVLKKFLLDVRHSHLKDLRNQILLYFKKMPDVVHLRNLIVVSLILSIVTIVMFAQDFSQLPAFSKSAVPDEGGSYNEGVIGSIEKINPLFISSDAEASANRLIFSGLTRVMPDNEIKPDLAESWQAFDNNQVYLFKLRQDVFWHDGKPFTADDVVFTVNLIENPDTRTPQAAVWQNVKVEKIADDQVKISLPNPFNNFLKVASQPIIPEHLLKDVDPQNIKMAQFNSSPVGTGPYRFVRFDQAGNETEVVLEAYEEFYPHKPYISRIKLRLYDSFSQLYNGLLRKQIDGITQIPYDKLDDVRQRGSFKLYQYYLPRYRVLVLNLKNPILATREIRQAMQAAINREEIIGKAVEGRAIPVYAPILPGKEGYDPALRVSKYDVGGANSLLEKNGWLKGADGYRMKEGKQLAFKMTVVNDHENRQAATVIVNEMKELGIKVDVATSDASQFQADYLRPRNFDMVLMGQNLGFDSDIYSFWHSSQINDPGLNISGFKDRKVDKLLEQIRKSTDPKYRDERYHEIQISLMSEVPAIFLYNPIYTIGVSGNVKGFYTGKITEPIDHLNNIYDWYIKEK